MTTLCGRRVRRCFGAAAGVLLVLALALAGGCSSTFQAKSVGMSGFLGDYSQLKPGTGEDALLVYVNPAADFKRYDKILIDPIKVYAVNGGEVRGLFKDNAKVLADYADATLREHLKGDYTLVDKAGPGVLRLRVAITEANGSRVLLDTVSTVMPIGLAVSGLKCLVTGSHTAVGSVAVECEGVDPGTAERLFAAVDARVGRKITLHADKVDTWHAAKDAFDYWAERLQKQLRVHSGKSVE